MNWKDILNLMIVVLLSVICVVSSSFSRNYCPVVQNLTFYTNCRLCTINEYSECPKGSDKLTNGEGLTDCQISVTLLGKNIEMKGCRHRCVRKAVTMQCCDGFWGPSCDECPGGAIEPCNNRGNCSDGKSGTGLCDCQEDFGGFACENCANDTLYGENCTNVCECVNGTCDNGINGTGTCVCDSGFNGTLCDQALVECVNVTCPNNSRCVYNATYDGVSCVCDPNFETVVEGNETICQGEEVDNCDPHPCHPNAECESHSQGFRCWCQENYFGDGTICEPINPCQVNYGGCVTNSSVCEYRSPNKSECVCQVGYEGYVPKRGCLLINVCTNKTVDCHKKATCATVGPGRYECTCMPGYTGNGKICYGNILQTLEELNQNDPIFAQRLYISIGLYKATYSEALTRHGPFTIFVPIDRGYAGWSSRQDEIDKLSKDTEFGRQIIRQHMIVGQFSLSKLYEHDRFYTLEGSEADMGFKARTDVFKYKIRGSGSKAKVVKGDIPASNGMIHLINSVMKVEPGVKGDPKKSFLESLKDEGRYNRLRTLIVAAGMESFFEQDDITVFPPENGAWDALPANAVDYLTSEEQLDRLRIILKNHVIKGKLPVSDIIQMKVMQSMANNVIAVQVSPVGQILLDDVAYVSQTDIPMKNGIYHHIESVLVPQSIGEIIPKRCDDKTYKTIKGICGACYPSNLLSCPLNSVSLGPIEQGCGYWVNTQRTYLPMKGCQKLCNRTYTTNKCCSGFYGQNCLTCPGGFLNPCNGKGKCNDGMYGNGTCSCNEGFTGPQCEYCVRKNHFGPNCSQECSCLFGICNDGIKGDGLCKKNTCSVGYRGKNCEQKLMHCSGISKYCHVHSTCFRTNNTFECLCNQGYELVNEVCQEIDPCSKPDRGGCHLQAKCTKVGPDMPKCDCNEGWIGDGFECYPATPCFKHQDCHPDAECRDLEPGNYNCMCKKGFHGNGTYCQLSNSCNLNNGGCHEKAKCISTGPGTNNCTCIRNYGGDGFHCYSSIAEEIRSHPNLTVLAKLLDSVEYQDNLLEQLESNYTFFAPTDEVFRQFLNDSTEHDMEDEENILTLIKFHTLDNAMNLELIKDLNKFYSRFDTLYDGYSINFGLRSDGVYIISIGNDDVAKIIQPDIIALNGFIHIIDQVLIPTFPDSDLLDLEEFFTSHSQYSFFGQFLEQKGLVETLEDKMNEYTLLMPTNEAFINLDMSITKKLLQYYIVPKIYLTMAIEDGQMVTTILGKDHRLQFTRKDGKVYVNNVLIEFPDHLTEGGVVHGISGLLHPVIHRCDQNITKQVFGPCISCQSISYPCPRDYRPRMPPVIVRDRCVFTLPTPTGEEELLGCHSLCYNQQTFLECCSGYYGEDCLECPGGPEVPCSGHGVCKDGINGTGECVCDERFTGLKCHLCEEGLTGPDCNITINSCDYLHGNCSEHAICEKVDGLVTCVCNTGFVGNGHLCQSPCDVNKDICHTHALCNYNTVNHSLSCECFEGYHGNGTWCEEIINQCAVMNGGCSLYAQCIFEPPKRTSLSHGSVNCECLSGYVGDGVMCNKDVLNTISQLTQASHFYQAVMSVNNHNLTDLFSDREEKITLFVPIDNQTSKSMHLDINQYVIATEAVYINISLIFSNNSYIQSLAGNILKITFKDKQFYVNGVRILKLNIPTLNGLVHLIEHPFMLEDISIGSSSQGTTNLYIIVGPVVAVVIVLLIAVAVVTVFYYKRAKSTGFLNFMKKFKKEGSDDSFARLQGNSSEEESDLLTQPGIANFNNPIYQAQQAEVEEYDN